MKKNIQGSKSLSGGHLILSKLNNLPRGYKVLRTDSNEVDSFLEGGEVDLMGGSFHLSSINLLPVQGGDFN